MQAFWNAKFYTKDFIYGEAPNNFVKENIELLVNTKKVMCLGEGEGRNAIYLADKGMEVEALDISDVALKKLRRRAKESYLFIKTRHTLFEYWQPDTHYDAVVCTYLHLPKHNQKMLFEKALMALNTNGYFIAELFSESQIHFSSGGPKNIALLYDLNDILDIVKTLPCKIIKLAQEVIVLNEGDKHVGRASVIRIILQKLA
ncbi:bifunctional 2-polyprenyl-6-hydroxyphenol methylase/3-demethylubiquinol 3-O-methyltransferase UbiG [Sulfurospirillum sp. UCH001]|uniref:class I SAM-dependent methyltransferase n=1 Tax=Sulfurospirillum sp. UCH001 TaxID=1581011 RepID=UPI00082E8596|nr:class I SAM-dependent methyltransferase [Sulfurospirillum sp. UCH001]